MARQHHSATEVDEILEELRSTVNIIQSGSSM